MKILVIGSKGFIGSHCVSYFKKQNHEVYCCDIVAPLEDEANYFQLDPEAPDFDSIFKTGDFEVCINASGAANVGFSIKYPEKDYELNVANVDKMLAAIKGLNPNCKFVNFSSAAVYGSPKTLPIQESAELSPLSPYGEHKLQSEVVLTEYFSKHKIPTCSMRIFSAYGPGLKKQLFWDVFQKCIASNKIELFGTGKESRDFIYIDDLMLALDCIINNAEFKGEVINVASGIQSQIKEVVTTFVNEIDSSIEIVFSGVVHEGNPDNWWADIRKLKSLGFVQETDMVQGVIKTLNNYKAAQISS